MQGILALPDVKKQLQSLGGDPVGGTPEEFASFVNSEIQTWSAVVQSAGFALE